jgi:DNA repair protein RadC
MLKRLPETEWPRERLSRLGAEALSLTELIAIVIGSGTKGRSVLQLAEELLATFGSLEGLCDASLHDLMQIRGLGAAKATQLKAVFAIATRSADEGRGTRTPIRSPDDAYRLTAPIRGAKREMTLLICRDVKGAAFHTEVIGVGILSEVLIHPRECFLPAIRASAASVILAHNHPSGNSEPSQADLTLTHHLLEASRILGIRLDDHLVVTRDGYASLWQQGVFPGRSCY